MSAQERLVRLSVEACPHCGDTHDFAALVRRGTLVFGGATATTVEVGVICPKTKRPLSAPLSLASGEEFVRLAEASETGRQAAVAEAPDAAPDRAAAEFAEWAKASRSTAVDFAKTMLTSSSASVAVYFAVLKYLGVEKRTGSLTGNLGVVPPILFLAAVVAFAVVLRPTLARVATPEDFEWFRDRRLSQLNLWITAGLALFVAGMAVAFVVFLRLLGLP